MTGQAVFEYPVDVLHLLVSPGHNYFGRPKDGPGTHPTYDRDEVELVTGKGVVGDRFFGRAAHLDAAVTLFAMESIEAIAAELRARRGPRPAAPAPQRGAARRRRQRPARGGVRPGAARG